MTQKKERIHTGWLEVLIRYDQTLDDTTSQPKQNNIQICHRDEDIALQEEKVEACKLLHMS